MKLENQVTSLELSRKLKELGVEQVGLWVWHNKIGGGYKLKANEFSPSTIHAYTVAELGEMLPRYVDTKKGYSDRQPYWICKMGVYTVKADNEAEARGQLLVILTNKESKE